MRLCLGLMMIIIMVSGCATPTEYRSELNDDGGVTITGKRRVRFLWMEFDEYNAIGAGEYGAKIGDKELTLNTKTEPFKLMGDINAGKITEN